MSANKINWEKIKKEVLKIRDLESLKVELNKIASEIKKFDINAYLSPSATQKLKNLEKRYSDLLKSIQNIQNQIDAEFSKTVSSFKKAKKEVEQTFVNLKKNAQTQGKKLKQKSKGLNNKKKNDKKSTTKKTTTKKATKKTTKKAARNVVVKKSTTKKVAKKK